MHDSSGPRHLWHRAGASRAPLRVGGPGPWLLALAMLPAAGPVGGQTIVRPFDLPAGAAESGVVIVRFLTGGLVRSAGRRIAVVDQAGEPVAYRLLAHDPAGLTVLAVDVRGRRGPMQLRYGPRPLSSAKRDNTIAASLVLRSYAIEGEHPIGDWSTLGRPGPEQLLGIAMVDQINLAHNPFGRDTRFVTVIEGLLRIGKGGAYRFFSAHDDMAAVEIDGKTVIQSASRQVQRSSVKLADGALSVSLTPGLHRIRYVHVQKKDRTLAVLGYMQNKRAVTVPAKMFVHHPVARLGGARVEGTTAAIGLDFRQVDQISQGDHTFTRMELTPISPAGRGRHYRWDFGNGVTEKAGRTEHVFVGPARSWKVKLELAADKGGTIAGAGAELRAVVFDDYQTIKNEALVTRYAALIGRCDYSRATQPVLEVLFELLETTERPDLMAPVADAYFERFGRRNRELAGRMGYVLAGHLADRQPQRAADLYAKVVATTGDSWMKASAAAEMLELLIFRLGKVKEAEKQVRFLRHSVSPLGRALLQARLGDAHRFRGDMQQARKAYQAAQAITLGQMTPQKVAVLQQAFRETALSRLRQRRFLWLRQTLLKWEANFPSAKLGTDLPLLTARYYQQLGNHTRAVQELKTLLEMSPLHPSRPEIAFRLAESLASLNKNDEAGKWFSEVAVKYPNSPFAARAAQRRR